MSNFYVVSNDDDLKKLAHMACEIWHQHYFDILSFEQIEYMLNNFQSVNALKKTDSIVTDIGAGFVMNDYIYTYFMSSV